MRSFIHRVFPVLLLAAFACGGSGADDAADASAVEEAPAREAVDAAPSAAPAPATPAVAVPPGTEMMVHKPTYCGCCTDWVDHVRSAGFEVAVEETDRPDAVKDELGVPEALRSCHTAEVGGYVVEGHVPADVIARLLEEKPDVEGIAVPGMPIGSPGMEADDGTTQPYDIVAFDASGETTVYDSR